MLDSTFQYNNTNDTTTEKYTYNGNLLTRQATYNYTSLGSSISGADDYTYDTNGNMIKDVNSDGLGNNNTIATFTYTDKPLNVRINPDLLSADIEIASRHTKSDGWRGNPIIELPTHIHSTAADASPKKRTPPATAKSPRRPMYTNNGSNSAI